MTWHALDEVDMPSPSRSSDTPFSEDRAGSAADLAWMLDGATAVANEAEVPGYGSEAHRLVEYLNVALVELAGTALPLPELVRSAIARTAARIDPPGPDDVAPSAALGVVRQAGRSTEYLVLADVSVILATGAGVYEVVDQRVDRCTVEAREKMRALVASGRTVEEALDEIRSLLAGHRRDSMNHDGGYWVASLEPDAVDHALVGVRDDVREVILATDGFMRAVNPFGIVEHIDALFEPGCSLPAIADQVRRNELADPDTRRHARWSTHDDICARRLRWRESVSG